jgi:hypothetical protein
MRSAPNSASLVRASGDEMRGRRPAISKLPTSVHGPAHQTLRSCDRATADILTFPDPKMAKITAWSVCGWLPFVFERPRNELQTKVLIVKESQTGQPSDLGIRCARVLQKASPQLNDDIVVNHDDVLSGKGQKAEHGRSNRFWTRLVSEESPSIVPLASTPGTSAQSSRA